MSTLTIGQLIKKEVERQHLTAKVFADKAGFEERNAYKIYNKTTIDIGQLSKIGKVLNHDFFKDLSEHPEMLESPEVKAYVEMKQARSQFIEVMPSVLKRLDAVPVISFGTKEQFEDSFPIPDFMLPGYRISFCSGLSLKERLTEMSHEGMQILVVSDHKGKEFDVFMDVENNEIVMIDIKLDYKTEEQWQDMMAYVFSYLFYDGFREDKTPEFRNGYAELNVFKR